MTIMLGRHLEFIVFIDIALYNIICMLPIDRSIKFKLNIRLFSKVTRYIMTIFITINKFEVSYRYYYFGLSRFFIVFTIFT